MDLFVEQVKEFGGGVLALIGGALILYGIGVFLAQVFIWLYAGEWIKLPLFLLLFDHTRGLTLAGSNAVYGETPAQFLFQSIPSIMETPPSWLSNPQKWIGVHKVRPPDIG